MVLTHGEYLDVLNNHHLVVALVEDGVINYIADILLVALGEE